MFTPDRSVFSCAHNCTYRVPLQGVKHVNDHIFLLYCFGDLHQVYLIVFALIYADFDHVRVIILCYNIVF